MISSTFHWKSNFTHGSDESLTFSTEILNLHSDRKFHCTESWHKPHLHTGRFTVKKKRGGGGKRFMSAELSGALSYKRQTCHPFRIMRWSHSLSGLQLGPVAIFSTYFTCQVKVWPKNSSSDHCQQLSHSLALLHTVTHAHTVDTHRGYTHACARVLSLSHTHTHSLSLIIGVDLTPCNALNRGAKTESA